MVYAPVVALEIGTTRTVALIGEMDQAGRISITGKGIYATHGVRKGMISEPSQVKTAVTAAVKAADDDANVDVGSVFLSIRGGCIQTFQNRGSLTLEESKGKVTRQDVEFVNDDASDFSEYGSEFTMLHTIKQSYSLDDQRDIVSPEGLVGDVLVLDSLGVCAKNSQYETLRGVVQNADYDVEEIAFGGLCSALAVLTPEQKRSGVAVIDLGGGTTDFLAYSDNVISAAGSFAVGGEHVTNDIAAAFSLRTVQAESLKIEQGNAKVSGATGLKRVTVSGSLSNREHSISIKALHTVINARIAETLKLVRSELLKRNILTKLNAGVIFTGGGAAMKGLTELGEDIFGVPCMVGKPNVGGHAMADVADEALPSFASTIGLVMYGFNIRKSTNTGGLFGRFFRGGKTR